MSEAVCVDVEARWFAGKGREVAATTRADALGPLTLADVAYADGGSERYLLTPSGDGAWAALLRDLADRPLRGSAGRLELRAGPDWDRLAGALTGAESVPSEDQTNTLAVLGERLLVKAYRRLEPGVHPEVEVLRALGEAPDAPVPGFAGSVHYVPDDGGPDTAIALLQEFVPGTLTGWEPPILAVRDVLRAGSRPADVAGAARPYRAAGRTVARLHAALAAALPTRPATAADRAAWREDAERALAEAADADPAFADAADAVRDGFAGLLAGPPPLLTRTHGDLHYAQLLRTPGRLTVIDFEGDPTRPLASRRAPDTPLRDLACLLRSIDHIGSAASRRVEWAAPDAWVAAARAEALAGYAEAAPVPVDPPLLRALELAKECGEAVYARRVLPGWAYVARLGLRRMLSPSPADAPDDGAT